MGNRLNLLFLQCRNGSGVCPDTMAAGGDGSNNLFDVTGQVSNGLTCVQYSRMLTTSELPCCVCVCPCVHVCAHLCMLKSNCNSRKNFRADFKISYTVLKSDRPLVSMITVQLEYIDLLGNFLILCRVM